MRPPYANRSVVLVLSALSICFLPTAARAQDGLQVVDAANVVLGPVVGIDAAINFQSPAYYFAYDQNGETAILIVRYPNRISNPGVDGELLIDFYYPTQDCSGAPAMTNYGECCSTFVMPEVIPDGLGQLWVVDETHEIHPFVVSRRSVGNSDSNPNACLPVTPAKVEGFPISLWGTLNFTPPLRVERNPFIFGDDFSSKNMEAWSNF